MKKNLGGGACQIFGIPENLNFVLLPTKILWITIRASNVPKVLTCTLKLITISNMLQFIANFSEKYEKKQP